MKRGDLFEGYGIVRHGKDEDGSRLMYQWQGEKRPPKKGEYYLSGATSRAYKATSDLGGAYFIVVPVKVYEKLVRTVVSMNDKQKEYKGLTLTLSPKGAASAPWDDGNKHYNYTLTVGKADIVKEFDFWGSAYDYENRTPENVDPLEVFSMVAGDALSYIQARDIDDFQAEFGYEKCSELLRVWESCKKTADDLAEFGLDEDALCDIANELNEIC